MKDKEKNKDEEIKRLKERIRELEKSEIKRKQAEEKIKHLNLVLSAVRNVNQLVVREKNRDVLIQKACEILTKDRGYNNAWIVLLDKQREYITSAEAGLSKSFIPMRKMLEERKLTNCGNAALGKKDLVITKDPKKECKDCPLSASYSGHSSYSISLRHNDNIYGLLSVAAFRHYTNDKEEQGLFKEVAWDIGFALHNIEMEEKRNLAEEALKKSEEKYRSLFETIEEGIGNVDERENFTLVNQAAADIFGYTKKEMIGKNLKEFTSPEIFQQILKHTSIRKKGESSIYGLSILRKNSEERFITITATPIFDKNGKYQGAFGIFHDITERKQAEQELEKHRNHLEELVKERTKKLEEKTKEIKESHQALSLLLEDVNDSRDELKAKTNELNISLKNAENEKDKIDAILKSIGEGLIVTDLDNKVILMNNVVEDLLNIRLSEVLNKPLNFIFDKKLQEKFNFTISEVEKGYQFDFELPSKNFKNPHIYNATASPIKDKKDKVTGIITIFHDVTQEHKIDQMKTNFISTAAHELRTPLTAIQGFSEILNIRDDLDDADKKKFLNYINNQAINLGNIINDMLDISRIESGRGFTLKLEKCKINEEILRTCSAYEISYPNYLFYAYLPDKELEVFIDRGKIEQVMENLLSNAVKYSTQGSKIRIKGKISGNEYIVTVEDEGIGMSPKELSRVFEKFFRGDYSNTSIKGTGLGMSIVKHIIEAHKGKVWLESKLGKGTKVHFSIPMPLKKIN